jgi:hypothetical protein
LRRRFFLSWLFLLKIINKVFCIIYLIINIILIYIIFFINAWNTILKFL